MARPKGSASASTVNSVVVEDKENEEVKNEIVSETATEEKAVEVVPETKKTEAKASGKDKVIGDDDEVKIRCGNLSGRSVIGLNGAVYAFATDGVCTVKGVDAKRFITIPGYEIVK